MYIENENFELNFSSPMKNWKYTIKEQLAKYKIKHNEYTIILIYESIKKVVCDYLALHQIQCAPNKIPRYEINRVYDKYGLQLKIRCNRLFWVYLYTFKDLTDYTQCFECYMEITDQQKLLDRAIFIPYENIIYGVLHNNKNVNIAYIQGVKDAVDYYHSEVMGAKILKELNVYEIRRFARNTAKTK